MGLFILGVLVGWLAEWLFFTYWSKSGSNKNASDCSELSAQLRVKNNEINSLKTSLLEAENSNTASKSDSISSLMSTASSKSKKAITNEEKSVAQKTTVKDTLTKKAPPKNASATKATAKSTTKNSSATKTATKKTVAKKKPAKSTVATKKATATTKKSATTTTTKKTNPTAKKTTAGAKKATATSKKTVGKKTLGDDLTKLSGIGPSMVATMAELGITTYKKLAAMDDDILRDMLEASGARLNNNKEAMDSWNEQATLADNGDFAGLKKLQDELKK